MLSLGICSTALPVPSRFWAWTRQKSTSAAGAPAPPPPRRICVSVEKLTAYRETVLEMFPTIPANLEYHTSLKDRDALALYSLLDRLWSGLAVVEVGTFIGAGSFLLASHPNVEKVYSIE